VAKIGDIQYRVECMSCGRRFLVDRIGATVPEHPPKGKTKKPYFPFIPCIGSETVGVFVETVIKGLD
jgi:hypothetical protein